MQDIEETAGSQRKCRKSREMPESKGNAGKHKNKCTKSRKTQELRENAGNQRSCRKAREMQEINEKFPSEMAMSYGNSYGKLLIPMGIPIVQCPYEFIGFLGPVPRIPTNS